MLLRELSGRQDAFADSSLKRQVETSALAVHLVTDADHRLLAASLAREQQWRQTASSLGCQSLWPYATEAIQTAEQTLAARGWWDDAMPDPVLVETGFGDRGLLIVSGRLLWERLYLGDVTPVRLCTSLD